MIWAFSVSAPVLHDSLQRILVASDDLDGVAPAVDKAQQLAGDGTEIRLLVTRYHAVADEPDSILPDGTRSAVARAHVDQARRALSQATASRGVDSSVLWTRDAADEIVAAAARWPAELLIKPVSPHHPVADYLHTPLDWALMRDAPCPVLVSRSGAWPGQRLVLAAVDAGDAAHEELSREILSRAAQLCQALDGPLHVVAVYPDLGQTVNELQVATDFQGIKADMRDNRQRALHAMLTSLALDVAGVHVLEGRPESVIPELGRRLGATVTVLGSAARRGVAKLLLGNTAENLISRLAGDLLTVRQPWS